MDIQGYLETMKKIQDNLLEFLENGDDSENSLQQFTNFLTDQHIQNDKLKEFLNLISKISMNHQRTTYFIKKIENILTFLKNDIKSKLSNTSLFNVFQDNKRILLFLIKNEFLNLDEYIYNQLIRKDDYIDYFQPELIIYKTKKSYVNSIFEENREKGENNDYLCELIRNDSIDEFITHINKTNISLKKAKIELSSFETNLFLLEKKSISLIEYAMFFGSIQIVKYLHLNNVVLNPSSWLFAIHSNNPEMIHFLEDNNVSPVDRSYKECFIESVKCHHNDIAHYIQDNLLDNSIRKNNFQWYLLEYFNFNFLSDDLGNEIFFNSFCKYDYLLLTNIIFKKLDVNKTINHIYFIII